MIKQATVYDNIPSVMLKNLHIDKPLFWQINDKIINQSNNSEFPSIWRNHIYLRFVDINTDLRLQSTVILDYSHAHENFSETYIIRKCSETYILSNYVIISEMFNIYLLSQSSTSVKMTWKPQWRTVNLPCGPCYYHGLNLTPTWISNRISKHFQTSPLKFGNG